MDIRHSDSRISAVMTTSPYVVPSVVSPCYASCPAVTVNPMWSAGSRCVCMLCLMTALLPSASFLCFFLLFVQASDSMFSCQSFSCMYYIPNNTYIPMSWNASKSLSVEKVNEGVWFRLDFLCYSRATATNVRPGPGQQLMCTEYQAMSPSVPACGGTNCCITKSNVTPIICAIV